MKRPAVFFVLASLVRLGLPGSFWFAVIILVFEARWALSKSRTGFRPMSETAAARAHNRYNRRLVKLLHT